ncbi:zinc finger and SCAN domain-containing protein 12-like isoform X2 [Thalassophryne amazonica]|uniref:zinc finger and SCAN domain-containing protein 12-like isoform X2 n=1 Tax=Thalassophryne amazonica TaxID=390379 RepID=UPI001471B9BA|nr:zinc finger and SCAN domain-containing protein 12-like isoform X2 [Thalassophryne amazonica]
MSGTEGLRLLVTERLTAAAEEIFGLFVKTISEYQVEVIRSKSEVTQLKRQLAQLTVLKPTVKLNRAGTKTVSQDVFPSQQKVQISVLKMQQENGTFEPLKIKEEHVEVSATFIPDPEADSAEDVKAGLIQSDSTGLTHHQHFPAFSSVTVTLNGDLEEECDARDDSSSSCSGQRSIDTDGEDIQEKKICRFCCMQFHRDTDLIRHMNDSHNGEKAFKCPKCGKVFGRRNHLTGHFTIHTGERPHRCHFCGMSFRQRSGLITHLRIHTGEKPYYCTTCGKMVARSYHLIRCAKMTLKGEKSFRCAVCGKKFVTESHLRVHLKAHESRKAFTEGTLSLVGHTGFLSENQYGVSSE